MLVAQKVFVAQLSGVMWWIKLANNKRYIFTEQSAKTQERSDDNLNIYKLKGASRWDVYDRLTDWSVNVYKWQIRLLCSRGELLLMIGWLGSHRNNIASVSNNNMNGGKLRLQNIYIMYYNIT